MAAAISMGGLPPFFGFLAKEEIYTALSAFDMRSITFAALAVAGNALMFAVAFAVALKPFIGKRIETPQAPHEAPVLLWLGPAVLALAGLAARCPLRPRSQPHLVADGLRDCRRSADVFRSRLNRISACRCILSALTVAARRRLSIFG